MPVALITCLHLQRHFGKYRRQYEDLGVTPLLPEITGQQLSAEEMRAHISGVDVVIAGDDVVDASVLEAGKASRLKAVVKWGIGTDGIDKARAAELGIPVFNTPGVFSHEVADLAMSLLLMLARRTHAMHASVAAGGWLKVEGRSLSGLTAGVVGLGAIGSEIARRAGAFGMRVLGHDVRVLEDAERRDLGVVQVPFDELLSASDVVILACSLTAENRHLMNVDAFGCMKQGSYLVNVSRGPLVDETALVAALADGRLAGAGLDVFEREPLPADSPLRRFEDRCVFTTHSGSNTAEAVARINQRTTDILFDVLGVRSASGFVPNRVA